jgi:hypothetical protein
MCSASPEAVVPALQGAGTPRYVEVKRAVSTWGLMFARVVLGRVTGNELEE